MVTAAIAMLLLAGCAIPGAEERVAGENVEALSEVCGMDLIYEWDGTPGPSTPAGALESTLTWFTEKARKVEGAKPDPTHHLVPEDDPVLSMIAIRALTALLDEIRNVEEPPGSSHEVSAKTSNGEEFAAATITEQLEGGYRVDNLRFKGFVSDHPDC